MPIWQIVLIIVVAFGFLFLSLAAWKLLCWRRRISSNPDQWLVIPDSFFDRLDNSDERIKSLEKETVEFKLHFQKLLSQLENLINSSHSSTQETLGSVDEKMKIYADLAEDRGSELKRYKDGYDLKINKQVVIGVINTIDNLIDYTNKFSNQKFDDPEQAKNAAHTYFEAARDQLVFLLEDQDIEMFEPEVNTPMMDVARQCTPVRKVQNLNGTTIGHIAEVIKPGFKLNISDSEDRIVREAQVAVYCE